MKYNRGVRVFSLLLCACIVLCSCGGSGSNSSPFSSNNHDSTTSKKDPNKRGSWDNTPIILTPSADQTEAYSCDVATIDASHSCEGYIMVNYCGTNPKVKLQITGPDKNTYTYDLNGGYETFPLTAGSGSYNVGVYENLVGTQYITTLSQDITVDITNEFGPYLYPNQYVNFEHSTSTVNKGSELAFCCDNDIEVVEQVYNFIIENFTYDYDKAETAKSGYLPDVDSILASNTGICFDYAAVMATMLRTQSIPTRLEVGYVGQDYHAWISTYIKDIGWVNGIIQFDGDTWNLMDPTFASTSPSPKDFITEDSDYITKYVY